MALIISYTIVHKRLRMSIKTSLIFIIVLISTLFTDLGAQISTQSVQSPQKVVLNGKEYYLHIIQKGEGLYRISVNYGLTMQDLLEANDDLGTTLKVGQILRIPIVSKTDPRGGGKEDSYTFHTVERGQTAYSISRKYNVPLDVLYEKNPGSEAGLIVGAILRIPAQKEYRQAPDSVSNIVAMPEVGQRDERYVYHTVLAGETIYSLSRKFNVTMDELLESNPALRSGVLTTGSEIRVLKAQMAQNFDVAEGEQEVQSFIENGDYLYHSILQGQTFYSISRLYQVDVEELKAANPSVSQDDLKVGFMLKIPKPRIDDRMADIDKDDKRLFHTHKVRRRETLYGISRHYHVDMELIKKINPDVNFQRLSNGDLLRIPTDAWFARQTAIAMADDREAEAAEEIDSSKFLISNECLRNNTLGYREPLRVALMLPFAAANRDQTYGSRAASLQAVRETRPASTRTRMFTEFYSGVLLALDTLKQRGINIDMSVYDIAPDTNSLKRVLRDPSLRKAHLIIGPALAHELPLVSDFSREYGIPLVYPMSNTNPELDYNPYLFHINTPDYLLFDVIADEIVRDAAGGKLIVIMPTEKEDNAAHFAALIKQKAFERAGGPGAFEYVEYSPGADELAELIQLMATDRGNYVLVPSSKISEVSRVVPVLYGVREQSKAEINFYGLSDVLRFQTVDPEQIHALNGTFFRSFGLDYGDRATGDFIAKYRQWYKTEPHAISPYFQNSDASSTYSRYGIWGYDVTNYFISALVEYGEDFDLCLDNFKHHQIQFNFNFERVSNWGGFYNSGLYKFRFRPDLKMERIKVN